MDNNAVATTTYTYGDDLVSQIKSAGVFTYHYDGLGSTRQLSDSAGVGTDNYNYEAFGKLINSTGHTENSYLYTGEQYDAGLDNYYLRARYYDQNVGRFTQMDTWAGRMPEPISLNKYTYAASSLVHFIDPSGNTYQLSDVAASFRVMTTLGKRQVHKLAHQYSRALFGFDKKDIAQEIFGIVGEALMDEAMEAFVEMLNEEESLPKNKKRSKPVQGTRAHTNFEHRVNKMKGRWSDYGITLRVEEFRKKNGSRAEFERQKGTIGLDVTVYFHGELVLGFDLKTGKGMSKGRRGRLKQRFNGIDIVEIMVTPRR
jgi:RHS repeat-associated protein